MGTRATRKSGILKTRHPDLRLQRILDSITERIEVLDGLRGDSLDKAVTFRDLADGGFSIGTGYGGSGLGPSITDVPTPGSNDGPTIGPAAPPTALAVSETFLALLITWDNPSFNLQHIEVWRSATDNLSTATLIGTTVSPQFIDYVGADTTYYYWARSVGTDGSYSAYNDTAGTAGTTGIDPGDLSIDPRFFTLDDGTGTALPFLTDGLGSIGIDGDLIVDGTIRAQSLIAGTIGTEYLAVTQLSGITADLGTITTGLLQTAASPAYRVEIQDQAATAYPFWYGSGAKSAPNGRFYFDQNGNVYVKGLLDAGMIAQTYFAPATTDYNSFRIACQYPANYSNGVYTGTSAHICPVKSTTQTIFHSLKAGRNDTTFPATPYTSPTISFYGPTYTGVGVSYGRLGSDSELLLLQLSIGIISKKPVIFDQFNTANTQPGNSGIDIWVEYQYSGDTQWLYLTKFTQEAFGVGAASLSIQVSTRTAPFDSIAFRYRITPNGVDYGDLGQAQGGEFLYGVTSSSLVVSTANFGYADNALTLLSEPEVTTTPLDPENLEAKPGVPQLPGYDGGLIP